MKNKLFFFLFLFISVFTFAQVKVGGKVVDDKGEPIPFASVVFKNSIIGTVSNDDGTFYLEADKTYKQIEVSFIGFETKTINVKPRDLNLKIVLKEENAVLDEIVIYSGKTKKKGNPAVEILKKIWAKKRSNGIYLYDQYQYDKYEKIEFDLNNIDSAYKERKLFNGIEFVFDYVDTSSITGKPYLPIFINESVYKTYGDNDLKKTRDDLVANTNSGFQSNQSVIAFVKDLYADYNIYNNYIKIFDKSFVSPLSRTGVNNYNYILADSAFIEDKWCYNIVYYPRRKGELTFKGDFWVNDTTFAVKEINMQATKSANINWVKDIYIEQAFEVLSDSVFLLKRDHMFSDFSFSKKEKSKGLYGKRTTLYTNYEFDQKKDASFYKEETDVYNPDIYNKSSEYWSKNRPEKLSKDEKGIYSMLDTLSVTPKFKRITDVISILGSGYIEFGKFDYGPIFSTFGKNDVEGIRIRVGGRTYLGGNEPWRAQFYTAYGTKDNQFKYGVSFKYMVDRKSRLTFGVGTRRDVEQTGVSLTTTNDVLGRSFASSAFFASGPSNQLTSVNLTNLFASIEPKKNLEFKFGGSYRTLKSADPSGFNLDYFDKAGNIKSNLTQFEVDGMIKVTPGRKTIGYGVERNEVNDNYPTIFLRYSKGLKGVIDSDFEYDKLQFYYKQPFQIGGFGRLFSTIEVGKTFGTVPLSILNVVPGNQSYFIIDDTYGLLDYYEFVTDTYASLHLEHNFNGRLFSRLPLLRDLNLREIVGVKAVWGELSQENIDINNTAPLTHPIEYKPPTDVYMEASAGVGNIFKVFRLDFIWKVRYRDPSGKGNFGIKGGFGFYF
ncbi:DUF5686 family protein [Aureivirga marina]|uniref:DUF5686 family protein n=1 Tax=Aureivirga marina TaxID=1182451 RepID=UPI0018C9D35D|nr:DUF5686 family protein [Aureivirga marina]